MPSTNGQRVEFLTPWNQWEPGTMHLSMIDVEGRQRVRVQLDRGITAVNIYEDSDHLRPLTNHAPEGKNHEPRQSKPRI